MVTLHNITIESFAQLIDKCKGKVFIWTSDGDRINLKSKLCQFVGIARMLTDTEITVENIECELREDYSTILNHLLFHK